MGRKRRRGLTALAAPLTTTHLSGLRSSAGRWWELTPLRPDAVFVGESAGVRPAVLAARLLVDRQCLVLAADARVRVDRTCLRVLIAGRLLLGGAQLLDAMRRSAPDVQ